MIPLPSRSIFVHNRAYFMRRIESCIISHSVFSIKNEPSKPVTDLALYILNCE
jgi:hypothetical protein